MISFSNNNQLLNTDLTTRELKNLKVNLENLKTIHFNIERTLPFEYIAQFMPTFLSLLGKNAVFSYSEYDTSLAQVSTSEEVDMYIFWMDWRLYMEKMTPDQCVTWIANRIQRAKKNSPILLNNWPSFWQIDEKQYSADVSKRGWIYQFNAKIEELRKEFSQFEIIDLDLLSSQIGMTSYDSRNDQVSNYPLSNKLTVQVARYISLQLLPALFEPKLKAIVLDLDNTLYSGILGEDGIKGISLTEEHVQLQQVLKKLKENGILLAISSKNELADVLEMFKKRKDFPLQIQDFTFIEANWNSKSKNIKLISEKFNFDVSAMLFIDDNPAEIAQVQSEIPTIHLMLADTTGKETVHRLINYPRLYSLKKDEMVTKRQQDILANQKRQELKEITSDNNTYLSKLEMKIGIYENKEEHENRVFELGQKTNQFNLSLKRFTNGEIKEKYNSNQYEIFTITLSDLLNDSGIIGAFICRKEGDTAYIEEVLFSCRALGRKVEDASLHFILNKLGEKKIQFVQFDTVEGPRNKPALDWIQSISPHKKDILSELIEILNKKLSNYPVEVIAYD